MKYVLNARGGGSYSQRHLGQLLLGEVERVIVGGDAKLCRVVAALQTRPQDAVVHHVEERADAVPALVVEPDLGGWGVENGGFFSFCNFGASIKEAGDRRTARSAKEITVYPASIHVSFPSLFLSFYSFYSLCQS